MRIAHLVVLFGKLENLILKMAELCIFIYLIFIIFILCAVFIISVF